MEMVAENHCSSEYFELKVEWAVQWVLQWRVEAMIAADLIESFVGSDFRWAVCLKVWIEMLGGL